MARPEPTLAPPDGSNLALEPSVLLGLFETMLRIRRFEETATGLFKAGRIKGTAHSYAGEEAIAAGTCRNLRQGDFIGSYHRGHGHCIAKGARVDRMMAELMGRATGYCGGLGGSMHIADLDLNILGANGVVGATMPLAVGAALAAKLRGTDQVAVAFFGDGASNQGVFHEALNLAAVWRLPVVFVCENNQYALNTAYTDTTSIDHISRRAAAYGVPGRTINGNDVAEVYTVVGEAVERARAGEGPSLIEAMTWRWGPHSMRANLREPRSEEARQAGEAGDPVAALASRLSSRRDIPADAIAVLRTSVEGEIEAAVTFAEESPEPGDEVLRTAVYAPHAVAYDLPAGPVREMTLWRGAQRCAATGVGARPDRLPHG